MKIPGGFRRWILVCGYNFGQKNCENFLRKIRKLLSLSLIYIGENWKVRKPYDCFMLINCLNLILIPEMSSTNNFTLENFFSDPLLSWGSTVGGRSKIWVREGGSGAASCFPGLPFPQWGVPINSWRGHPSLISREKLYVEFISGIRIVFRLFISEKKSQNFTLKPKLKILVDVCKREREIFGFS